MNRFQQDYYTDAELKAQFELKRATQERREKFSSMLASKNGVPVIVTTPDGIETEYRSAQQASVMLGLSLNVVGRWIKKGMPKIGKYKNYSARLK